MSIDDGRLGAEAGIVSAAEIEPVDVRVALAALARRRSDRARAQALVEMAFDTDDDTVDAVLDAVAALRNTRWRVHTLARVLQQMRSTFIRALPASAQRRVASIVASIDAERMRAAALIDLPHELPAPLARRLAAIGRALRDPALRIEVALHARPEPPPPAQRALLALALRAAPRRRAAALIALAPALTGDRLEAAFDAARELAGPDAAAAAMTRVAARWGERTWRAQRDLRERAARVIDSRVRFEVLASLDALDERERAEIAQELYELALTFEPDALRCRALLIVGGLAQDAGLRLQASKAGIAASECVVDPDQRAELLLLLHPYAARLDPEVRIALTHAVERMHEGPARRRLNEGLSRFFFYERVPQRSGEMWDLFVSYASRDGEFVEALSAQLESRGLRLFVSGKVIDAQVGSGSWMDAIGTAISSSRAMLVVATSAALESEWVAKEWSLFYQQIEATGRGALVTLRVGVGLGNLPETLRTRQVLEAKRGVPLSPVITRLLALVRGV